MFKINEYLLHDIENKNQPSEFIYTNDYSILILRLPYIKKDEVEVVSYPFVIKDEIYQYIRDKKNFKKLGDFNDLYKFLDFISNKILTKITKLHTQIANMEDDLYDGKTNVMKEWLKLKKELGVIERVMSHAIISFERFLKYYKNDIDEFAYNDLKEDLHRILTLSKSGIEKLDYLYDFYRAQSDEKMNHTMFVLTIISAIFMPLTLVTGFFGMNTGGLPFVDDEYGTLKVIIITLLFEIPFVWWIFKISKR